MNTEIGLYIHIPFCKSKCLYCDYPSTTNNRIQDKYFEYLLKEIDLVNLSNKIKTVFLGGGTPTYVSIKHIEKLFKKINANNAVEITIESNPETLTKEKLNAYFSLGINRLSLGIQTFNNNILRSMNRLYDIEIIERNYYLARRYFSNINLDFILGLPGDNMEILENNLRLIEKLHPEHVSYYIFDDDHNTPLKRLLEKGKMQLPEYEFIEKGFDLIIDELRKMGYVRYEISNWAKKGYECKHNIIYWNNEDYHGLGLSAGGHIKNIRYTKTWDFKEYFDKIDNNEIPYYYYKENSMIDEFTEELFMGLRLINGIEIKKLKKKYGSLYEKFFKILFQMVSDLIIIDDRIRMSKKGLDLSKMVFEKILEVRENIYEG
ncbi:oxygen-independent coproporphyrinogen-3 oxidase [Marinitoga hydrogenitolerans DSM 16785]|uniref:Heme chaperone HemW n=1 Tax=Marinitoga hydrogenitolerans (strain DSM 16785 / JCM 12826 / AT1271) TaxID=1122195 RepID=A0A1M4Y2W7_MARH1|nr:radical SAM family heme chaperone HemW [Marinitoga hydrogenitolerans]SHF00040.1 oxygen-independent coproporphyrinogen-3 oxidase [Marinitoga hydrogenitolerans DSM 16785]